MKYQIILVSALLTLGLISGCIGGGAKQVIVDPRAESVNALTPGSIVVLADGTECEVYRVQLGDIAPLIAKKFGVKTSVLTKINGSKIYRLTTNMNLLIPQPNE